METKTNKIVKRIEKAGFVVQKKQKQNRIGDLYEVLFIENEKYIFEIEVELEQYNLIYKPTKDLFSCKSLSAGLRRFQDDFMCN